LPLEAGSRTLNQEEGLKIGEGDPRINRVSRAVNYLLDQIRLPDRNQREVGGSRSRRERSLDLGALGFAPPRNGDNNLEKKSILVTERVPLDPQEEG